MATSLENIDKSKVSATRIEGLTEAIQEELSTAVTGAASTIVTSNLTANRAVISNGNGKVAVSSTTSTELGYVHGVTSAIQTQINGKQATLVSGTNIKTVNNTSLLGSGNVAVQATITGASTTVTSSNLTANRALISNSSGKIAVSSITSTKLGYLSDVTSNIQAQINNCSQAIVGSIIPYGGSTAPSGYLLCDGSAVSRTTYSALFTVIGTTYGEGDGNTTFNLPTSRRVITEVQSDTNNWCRIYSDGWCEQGGYYNYPSGVNNATNYTYSYIKQYVSIPSLIVTIRRIHGGGGYDFINDMRTDGFTYVTHSGSGNFNFQVRGLSYFVSGYISDYIIYNDLIKY